MTTPNNFYNRSRPEGEFELIEKAFQKLPALTGNGSLPVFVNSAATALEAVSAATARTSLGLVIGTNVQAWDANLDQIAALAPTNNNFIVGTGSAWALETPSDARTSLGLGTIATQNANSVNIDGGTIDDITLDGTIAGTPEISGSWTWTTTSAATSPVTITSTEAGASAGPLFDLFRDSASPAAADTLGGYRLRGRDSAGNATTYAQILGIILDATNTSEDGDLRIQTIQGATVATRMVIANGMYMVGATGGDQGAGTINATAAYDDSVILTDYPLDGEIDGRIDLKKYDDAVPNRIHVIEPYHPEKRFTVPVVDDKGVITQEERVIPEQEEISEVEIRVHEPARRFEMDDLDIARYAEKWRATRKLPAFDRLSAAVAERAAIAEAEGKIVSTKHSLGEMSQATLETLEVHAVHIDKLLARVVALENKLQPQRR